jgi:hypothetical protein
MGNNTGINGSRAMPHKVQRPKTKPRRSQQTDPGRIVVQLPPTMLAQLDAEAGAAGLARSGAIVEACEEWIRRQLRRSSISS